MLAHGPVAEIERRLRVGAVYRIRVLGDAATVETARAWLEGQVHVATAAILKDGEIEIGFQGDDEAASRLLADAVMAGTRIATFARAASDLEELFLQVTDPGTLSATGGAA